MNVTFLPNDKFIYPEIDNNESPFLISLEGRKKQNVQRPPINLLCLVDTSGSMDGENIRKVKKTLHFCYDKLFKEDRFAVVSFDSESRVV